MELLEREPALGVLQSAFDAASGGDGRLLLVAGEAGVGKTSLLRAFTEAHPRGVRLLWGRCEPVRTPGALSPLLDVAETTAGEVQELLEAGARPHEVVLALLRELRRRSPTVLVLEDLHWADEATLDLLTLLAGRRLGARPAVAIIARRLRERGVPRSASRAHRTVSRRYPISPGLTAPPTRAGSAAATAVAASRVRRLSICMMSPSRS